MEVSIFPALYFFISLIIIIITRNVAHTIFHSLIIITRLLARVFAQTYINSHKYLINYNIFINNNIIRITYKLFKYINNPNKNSFFSQSRFNIVTF